MLFGILLTLQIIICVAMGGLILIQQSEGGALGMGGGPSGFMSARGAGNLLTRLTGVLAFLFFANCVALTAVGNMQSHVKSAVDQVDTSGLTLPVSGAATSAAASSSASSAGPSLSDLPLGAPAPAASQAPAPQAGKTSSPLTALPPPVTLPQAAPSSSASQKQVEAAKNAIWQSSSASKASQASKEAPKPASPSSSSAAQ